MQKGCAPAEDLFHKMSNKKNVKNMASFKKIIKTTRTIGMAVMVVIVCVFMTACSSDEEGDETEYTIVGTWYTTTSDGYKEWIFKSDGTCGWKEYESDKKTISWYDTGTYQLFDNILSIWWESERKLWDEGPWSTVITINGKTMTTSENRSIVWKKK